MFLNKSLGSSALSRSLLRYAGLERTRPRAERVMDVVAFVTLGLVVGVGVGLLVAKKPGTQLRAEIRDLLGETSGSTLQTGVGAMGRH